MKSLAWRYAVHGAPFGSEAEEPEEVYRARPGRASGAGGRGASNIGPDGRSIPPCPMVSTVSPRPASRPPEASGTPRSGPTASVRSPTGSSPRWSPDAPPP
ncbi:hypothetical protein [Streptomyces sp. NPDC047976]|uniref:hypothetical protein n=1 Tax=Streptomyces sp. NPDC047976 TaxID=3155746 RepID=UPI003434EC9E